MERLVLAPMLLVLASCGNAGGDAAGPKTPYEEFLQEYDQEVAPAFQRWRQAAWRTHTEVVPGDATRAELAMAAFEDWRTKASDPRWVRTSRELLRNAGPGSAPTPLEKAAIDAVARTARLYPGTDAELMKRIDDKTGLQARLSRRSKPRLDGEDIHPDELARRYAAALDTAERKAMWKSMLAPAGDLKPTFAELRDLRNDLARKGGWSNHIDAQFDAHGMTTADMAALMVEVELALRPLYQELHTWARVELAERYAVDPPDLIPAHWLPAPLGEDWSGLVHVEHTDPEPALQAVGAKQMLRDVEAYYVGTGLPALPETFWERSSLLPVPPGARVGKTQGASTWDIDLRGDVRVLMSARPAAAWLGSAYREFAFAHAFQLRASGGLPVPLRQQPPGALLASLGLWADLAASRPGAMLQAGLLDQQPDPMLELLHEALIYVPFVSFGAGAVVPFEHEVYASGLPPGQMNSRWWGLLAKHQGIFPPETRTERWSDFLAVDALVDSPGRYADHVLAVLLAFQLHEALCTRLGLDPRTADLSRQPGFGQMFQTVALAEGVEDWRKVVQDATGAPPSADALVRYFQPLQGWLRARNVGRAPTLPSLR